MNKQAEVLARINKNTRKLYTAAKIDKNINKILRKCTGYTKKHSQNINRGAYKEIHKRQTKQRVKNTQKHPQK